MSKNYDTKLLIEIFSLKNANEHDGKINQGSVIGKLISINPEFRKEMKTISIEVKEKINELSKLSNDKINEKLDFYKQKYPELFI